MAWSKVASHRLSSAHELELWLEQRTQDVAANSTVVGYEMGIRRISSNSGGYWNNNTSTASLAVNGVSIGVDGFTYDFSSNYYKVLANGEITVAHAADGSKYVSISGSVSMNGGSIPSGSTSGGLNIQTIPRASSFTAPSSYVMGNLIKIDIQRATSAFTHVVNIHYGNNLIFNGGGFTTSASLDVDHGWLYGLTPNVASATLVITLGTYLGGNWVGSSTRNITAINGLRPTFASISHVEAVAGLASKFGAYIQSKSRIKVGIVGAVASTGASVTGYRLTVDNQALGAVSGTTQSISSKGTQTITGTVTDSRGFTFTRTLDINILEYTPPAVTGFDIYRTDSSGVPNDYGTHAKFELSYKVTPLGNKNTVATKVKVGSNNVNAPQSSYVGKYVVQYGGFDVNLPYNVELIVTDYFGETISPQILVPGATALVLGRDWASVGQYDNKGPGTFSVAKEIFSGGLMVAALGGIIVEYDE